MFVRQKRKECQMCQETLVTSHKYGKVKGDLTTEQPFKEISSDIFGPILSCIVQEENANLKFYLLTITDRCTRWSEVYWLSSLKAKEIPQHFEHWIENNGNPETILTDQGTQYTSDTFIDFCKTEE